MKARRRRRTSGSYRKRRRPNANALRKRAACLLLLVAAAACALSVLLIGMGELPPQAPRPGSRTAAAQPGGTPAPHRLEIKLSGAKHTMAAPTAEPAAVEAAARTVPRVLIYHTHATEAYTMTEVSSYEQTTEWRTEDPARSVIAVGSLLAELLRGYGIHALHDQTDHEPPKLSTAYSRSEITMKTFRALYPSIELYIDVHRDAYGREDGIHDVALIDGEEVARLMFVVGTGEGATGTGFAEMPDYESNLALATELTHALGAIEGSLVRPVRVKTGRYNQHISGSCLLVEVGHNANTLEQALSAAPYLARVIADHLNGNGAASSAAPLEGSVWVPGG